MTTLQFGIKPFLTALEQSELYCTEIRIMPPKSLKCSGAGAQIYTMELKKTQRLG